MNSKSWDLNVHNIDSCILTANIYLHLSKQYNDIWHQANANQVLGSSYFLKNKLNTSLNYYTQSFELYKSIKDSSYFSSIYESIGDIYLFKGKFLTAIEYFNKALKTDEAIGFKNAKAYHAENIASIYMLQENYAAAEVLCKIALKENEKNKDKYHLANNTNRLAEIFIYKEKIDSALILSNKALNYAKETEDVLEIAYAYSNLSDIAAVKKDFKLALDYAIKAEKQIHNYGDPYSVGYYKQFLAKNYLQNKQYQQGLRLAQEAYHISIDQNSIILKRDASLILAQAFEDLKQYSKALKYFKIHLEIKNQLHSINIKEQLLLNEKRAVEKENELLNKSNHQKENLIKRNSEIIYAILFILIIFIGLSFLLFTNVVKAKKFSTKLIYKNEIIRNKQLKIDQQKATLEQTNRKLEELNQSKDKLFSILTHDLKQPFNQLITTIDVLESMDIPKEDKASFYSTLRKSIEDTKQSAESLLIWTKSQFSGQKTKPIVLKPFEVMDIVIKQLSASLTEKALDIENSISNTLTVYIDKDHLEIILRNLLVNAIKFSNPDSSIAVRSGFQNENMAFIEVQDFGEGMSRDQIERIGTFSDSFSTPGTLNEKGTGLGLLVVHEFLGNNNGALEIKSELNKGTTFKILIPTQEVKA